MNHSKISFVGIVVGIVGVLAGVQGALASCMGTVYFKAPSSWEQVVFSGQGVTAPGIVTEKNADGYYEYDLSLLGMGEWTSIFGITNKIEAGITSYIVSDTAWLVQNPYENNGVQNHAMFKCPTSADAKIYIAEDILNPGKTFISDSAPSWKYFYVLVPEEKEWQSDDLMVSYTDSRGQKQNAAMLPSPEYCGWHYFVFESAPTEVVLYLKNYPDVQLGVNGLWDDDGAADPIDMSVIFEAYSVNRLYFIPDDAVWPDDGTGGWYVEYPNVDGTCTFSLAAIIYDTDESLNTAFTSDGNPVGPGKCVGAFPGLVKEDLGPDGKPQYSGSADAQMCFGLTPQEAEENFYAMFNYVEGKNEMQCYDMPFRHYGSDTRWGFDSDSTHYDLAGHEMLKGGCNADSSSCVYSGGFYPLEWPDDEFKYTADSATVSNGAFGDAKVVVIDGKMMGPNQKARTKRESAAPVPLYDSVKAFDHYCNTAGWFDGIDCGAVHAFNEGSQPPVWNWGVREDWQKMNGNKKLLRNQQYCFQSHATFTYNESQEFTFRGDDDIWVFINKKIAVDNGGAHLATPGHVVLKNLNTTYGAGFLVPGQDYDLDIFFCDRRRTMTNVIIKTNMYIKQSTGLDFSTQKKTDGGLQMNICVEKSGGGDCASVALGKGGNAGQEVTTECGGDISAQISYSITTRKGEIPAHCDDCAALPYGSVVHGGIDLSNPKIPVVYPDKITGLAPGSYRLVIEVDGKKTYYSFRIKGNLGIVSKDVVFDNVDKEAWAYNTGTKWKFIGEAMAGTRIPVYISAPDDQGGVDLISAPGQNYSLTLSAGASLYRTNDPDDNTPIVTPYAGTVNSTGIDTLWVEVPLAGLASGAQEVTASVGNTSAKLTFYAPTITFAEPATKDSLGNVLTWNPVTQDPDVDEDGDEYFHWVSSDVDFYVIAMNPVTNSVCKECNFVIDLGDASLGTSDGIGGQVSQFNEGVALVRIRSNKEYSTTAASMVVIALENSAIAAPYGNMHFYKPPAPMPLIVDMFDVKGAPIGEMNIPSQFHNESAEYLDGKADSMAIIYDRAIHTDSVPKYICLNFDENRLEKINPYEMGISNNSRDTEMFCSTQFDSATVRKAYEKSPDGGRTLVFAVDEPLSRDVKTLVNPDNKIASFTQYEWKGKPVKTFFEKGLTDRMAPVILSARASNESDGGVYDQVRIVISEPVTMLDASMGTQAFSYYLNSAIDIASESARYIHVTAQGKPQDKKDTLNIRYYNADPANPTPHVGDYIRFRADAVMWSDTSKGVAPGMDTLRSAEDADWHWNSPTNYNETKRLPSPWVQVVGDAKIDVTTISYNIADPSRVTPDMPVVEVFPVKTNENMDKVKADHPGTLGHFVQSDMGSIIGSKDEYASLDKGDVYFYYEVDYFTNLGNFVAHQSGKLYCNDKFFSPDPSTTPDGMGDCIKNPRNFYIAWNMLSDKHRLVGTGAYITKYSSFVKLGDKGKKAKKELTEVWGVKRGKGVVK